MILNLRNPFKVRFFWFQLVSLPRPMHFAHYLLFVSILHSLLHRLHLKLLNFVWSLLSYFFGWVYLGLYDFKFFDLTGNCFAFTASKFQSCQGLCGHPCRHLYSRGSYHKNFVVYERLISLYLIYALLGRLVDHLFPLQASISLAVLLGLKVSVLSTWHLHTHVLQAQLRPPNARVVLWKQHPTN